MARSHGILSQRSFMISTHTERELKLSIHQVCPDSPRSVGVNQDAIQAERRVPGVSQVLNQHAHRVCRRTDGGCPVNLVRTIATSHFVGT